MHFLTNRKSILNNANSAFISREILFRIVVVGHFFGANFTNCHSGQSKHLKGWLGPHVGDGHVFGSMEVSWDPASVT